MPNQNVSQFIQSAIHNAMIPQEGPKAVGTVLNMPSPIAAAQVDLTQNLLQNQISFIQGLFIDNSLSSIALITVIQGGSNQKIVTPPGSQQYVPVVAQSPPIFNFFGAGGASPNCQIPVFFFNVPLPAMTWGGGAQNFSFAGNNLLVQDTAAEGSLAALAALIAAGGLNVNVIAGGGGGSTAGPYAWKTVTIPGSSGGATFYTPSSGKKFLVNNLQVSITPLSNTGGVATTFPFTFFSGTSANPALMLLDVLVPAAAPTLTNPAPNILVFSADDMGMIGQNANDPLVCVIGGSSFTGSWVINLSTLVGDHA